MKREILYPGLDVHAEDIAVALASVTLSAVSVSNACGVCHRQICRTHLRLLVPRSIRAKRLWKQWQRSLTRRRNLRKLGANPKEVHLATRSRKGYWRMSANSIVQRALNNRWLKEQGVPALRSIWLKLHHRDKARAKAP